jgi:hypothetical protein
MMAHVARTALHEVGRADLALLVFISKDRPSVNWSGMARPPRLDEVQVMHAALRRAYQACAPDEIGEAAGQFTDDVKRWHHAILGRFGLCRCEDPISSLGPQSPVTDPAGESGRRLPAGMQQGAFPV